VIGRLTLSQAAIAYGGTLLYPDCEFSSVSTDSRTLVEGELFVALQGGNFDGHDFLTEVATRACGLVVSEPDKMINLPQWVVADTTVALGQLARLNRNRFEGVLVALTGSAGKTTVKEMIARILGLCGPTLATRGNLNNHIGVPKTLFELNDQHRYAVVEMGASGPGEIAYLGQIAKPDVVLVNNVMPAHLEGFGSEAMIAETKGAIYRSVKQLGTAVINLDESWAYKWQGMCQCATVLGYSLEDSSADIGVDGDVELAGEGSRFVLRVNGQSRELFLPVPGRHNIANALAAAACAHASGASLDSIVAGLESMQSVKGRGQILPGLMDSQVIDDTYNANPGSVKAAIDVLAERVGKRILVLGDMAELGSMTTKGHRDTGLYAREKGIDQLFVIGRYGEHSARGFGPDTRIFDSRDALVAALKSELDSQTTVLVKGSRSSAMEKIVEQIIEEGAHASVDR
jgi:UDP-N-acetylmuramoyl-tripeptide--D-alanyl-D-alanine ligase